MFPALSYLSFLLSTKKENKLTALYEVYRLQTLQPYLEIYVKAARRTNIYYIAIR